MCPSATTPSRPSGSTHTLGVSLDYLNLNPYNTTPPRKKALISPSSPHTHPTLYALLFTQRYNIRHIPIWFTCLVFLSSYSLCRVCMLSDGCRMLELLNLSWCDQITRDGIEALARGCNGLRGLFLRGCTQVQQWQCTHTHTHIHTQYTH